MRANRVCVILVAGAAVCLAGLPAAAPAPVPKPPTDPPPAKVREAQDKAVKYLKGQQKAQGAGTWNWENDSLTVFLPGGMSALATLALLESGLKADDEAVARGLAYLRTVDPKHTYVVSLQTQVFCKAGQKADADRIKRNVKWLEEAAVRNGEVFEGWSYVANTANRADHSNTRYAVAALHDAHAAGYKPKQAGIWTDIAALFVRTQRKDGGWGYAPELKKMADAPHSTHTMTLSGLLCLRLAKSAGGQEDKSAEAARRGGEAWVAGHFQIENPPHTLYNLDVIAALGRAAAARELGTKDKTHEWYRLGADWLLKNQKEGGEWKIRASHLDEYPVISTSFALRFLASRPD